PVRDEFLEHAEDEEKHAKWIAERIVQLGGTPNFDPDTLRRRSQAPYAQATDLLGMIHEDLVAERIAILTYTSIIRWLGDTDPTTSQLLTDILEKEEEHA